MQTDAPAAPVRAGEVDEEVLALVLRSRGGGIEIVVPELVGGRRRGQESETAECHGGKLGNHGEQYGRIGRSRWRQAGGKKRGGVRPWYAVAARL